MNTESQQRPHGHQRKLRNYLLDKKFQLKYTGIVIGITAVLSAVLGYYLYQEIVVSQNTILARNLSSDTFVIPPSDPSKLYEVTERLHEEVGEAARAKLSVVVSVNNAPAGTTADLYQESFGSELQRTTSVLFASLVIFLLVLAVIWVYLTHKIAGPVYKLKLLFSKVTGENLKVEGRLRKGDELQDTFTAFSEMIERLRDDRRDKALRISEILERIGDGGTIEASDLEALKDVQSQMLGSVDD